MLPPLRNGPQRLGPRVGALLALLTLHVGFFAVLTKPPPRSAPAQEAAGLLYLQRVDVPNVVAEAPTATRASRAVPKPRPPARRPESTQPAAGALLRDAPAGPADPRIGSDTAPAPQTPSPATGPAVEPPAPPRLDLKLNPRFGDAGLKSNPAVQAQIGRAPPRTLESRIAGAVGIGRWVEQRIDGDTIRLKNGDRCVLLVRSRIAQIDPMSPSARALPWMAGREFECRE